MARSRVVVVAILAAASLGGWLLGEARQAATAPWKVVEVLDGDTIRVARGNDVDTIRILGVDTPETHHPTKPVQCFGPEASEYTTERLLGHTVSLEDDVERHDRYGRRLAYVVLAGGARYDDELLRFGYARLLVIEPNHAHVWAMLAAELDARRHRRGLWGAC